MTKSTAPNYHCSTFKTIEETSQKLLAKGNIAQFVNKEENSKVVVQLVERLQQAIVCYQVSEGRTSVPSTVDVRGRCHNSKRSTSKSQISP